MTKEKHDAILEVLSMSAFAHNSHSYTADLDICLYDDEIGDWTCLYTDGEWRDFECDLSLKEHKTYAEMERAVMEYPNVTNGDWDDHS